MSQKLDSLWSELTNELSISTEDSDRWLAVIKETYQNRICYDLPFLQIKLEHFQKYRSTLKNPNALFLALIFQSIYYDTKSTDNAEKCIEKLREFATETGIDKNTELVDMVCELIELSVTNSTEEHLTADIFGKDDRHYFLDMNLVMWAAGWEEYSEFSGKTRKEYDFLNDTAYTSLRLKVLQSLLQIPNLFATQEFRSQYEEKARENIKKEINSLK